MPDVVSFLKTLAQETIQTSRELLKITIPVVCVTKLLEEAGVIVHLSNLLEPVMVLLGLPGVFGIVWATAILSNLYAAMMVFAALAPGLQPTIAQTTILCSLMLIAHSLPLELSISKRAGVGFCFMGALRLAGAFLYGLLLHFFTSAADSWQKPSTFLFHGRQAVTTFWQWGGVQMRNLVLLVAVVFCIILVMRILRAIGVLTMLERFLAPALPLLGMSRRAAPLTVVGMLMGISYGGALIIREATSGRLERQEIMYSLALMGLSHSLVEDTLLMTAMGGSLVGILGGRVLFSLAVVFLLVRFMGGRRRHERLSDDSRQ